ncbi:hypothetical protein BKA56DRAFT_479076 [Ilyonectria sp. MPI-CAGE-AT-0026]|nr:hypothetical protein BKA56DRAFT_479076 [Ilyonectria sp. MPI-CAGE-AT-0026]
MSAPTALGVVLTTANIVVDGAGVQPGPNTSANTVVGFEDWIPWRDFNFGTLVRIFGRELNKQYQGSPQQRALPKDLSFNNEGTLEDILRKFDIPVVNYCLETMAGGPHFARGSRCGDNDLEPDWSLVSDFCRDPDGRFANVLPGETKPHDEWCPSMKDDPRPGKRREWQKVMSQATTYMMHNRSRYGFIITDKYLVTLRLTRENIGPGLANNRPRRKTRTAQYASESEGGSGSDHKDDDPLTWAYKDPEYLIVPWDAHGDKLTVKLTLWFLAMMATHGDRYLDYSYPDLNSWRRDGNGYVHNTSGAKKSQLAEGDKEQEPDPDREAREAREAGNASQAGGSAGGNARPSVGYNLRPRRG